MTHLEIKSAKEELIQLFHEFNRNPEKVINSKVLEKNNLTRNQWESFVNLSRDLDLNDDGKGILLEEIFSGRVTLPTS